MSEYKHGSMDITAQEKTFEGFMKFGTRMIVVIVAVLIILAVFGA